MSEQGAVPLIVMTRSQDHVEAINSTLRNAGHPVHCTWLPDARDLSDAITQLNPELLIAFIDELGIDVSSLTKIKQQSAPEMPVVIVREQVDEAVIADAMRAGAQDVVTLANRSRLQSVVDSRAARLSPGAGALQTFSSAREYREQLQRLPRGLGRCDHARAGRHHRRCQQRVARAVRLLGRGCAHRHAADGSVRARDPSGAEGRAGGLPAGQVDRSCAQGAGAALGRLERSARADADAQADYENEPATRISIPAHNKSTDHDLELQLAEPSRTMPRRGFCSSAISSPPSRTAVRMP